MNEGGLTNAGAGAGAGAGGGGADPISAIANAIGDIFTSVSSVIISGQQKDLTETELQYEATQFKWFYQPREGGSSINTIIIISIFAIIIILILAIIFKKSKN
jgi:hypothetical protein